MRYYEVFVSDQGYQKADPLTYQFEDVLKPGDFVIAPVRNKKSMGFVSGEVPKPKFKTKSLEPLGLPLSLSPACLKLFDWLQRYYPGGSGSTARQFLPANLTTVKNYLPAVEYAKPQTDKLPPLTPQQKDALTTMSKSKQKHFLLHGDTGTGKTRLYVEKALEAVEAGRSVLVLTPEIALTPQLNRMLSDVFGNRVIITHSALTPKQRRETWLNIAAATVPVIVIGPRSALFSPLANIGLIVVDEAHEQAYKQEQAPRYLATRVASALADIHGASLILGSATPLITDYYVAQAKKLPIIRMTSPAIKSDHSVTSSIIDLRNRSLFNRSPYISDELVDAIGQTVQAKEQALIYLNRRGTARLVLCQTCGWQAMCPHCDLPLTYHGDAHEMRCHSCSFRSHVPIKCPDCGNTDLVYKSIGTKALTEELKRLFPKAVIKRFDTDVSESERFERHYEAVRAGEVDILVGTQMLAKGLDLPRLSLVAVIAADSSLHFPDYTAAERTYELLYQVLGRVGRGHRNGRVYIQTYQPDNPVLIAAVDRNWDEFYAAQLKEREMFMFPPFCYLLKLSCARKSQDSARRASTSFAAELSKSGLRIDINGPSPSFYEQSGGNYHWQLIIKARSRGELIKVLPLLPANWTYDLDPVNLL